MNSAETGVPLKALGDVLQSRKDKLPHTPARISGTRRALGAESIMDIWREARSPDEESPKSNKEGIHRV